MIGAAVTNLQSQLGQMASGLVVPIGSVGVALLVALINVVRLVLFVILGWLLLLDISRALRVELPEFFFKPGMRRLLIALAAASGVLNGLPQVLSNLQG